MCCKEMSDACREYGLKFGIYISPWDRNHPLYGTPKYNAIYKQQWRELLTNYGEVFESWLDGANDNKKRMVYDFDGFFSTITANSAQTMIFSDAGPGHSLGRQRTRHRGRDKLVDPRQRRHVSGLCRQKALNTRRRKRHTWIPAECDVSIRPGWFYHAEEDKKLKSVDRPDGDLLGSVGRNCNLLLNIGVDRRGLVNENDIAG